MNSFRYKNKGYNTVHISERARYVNQRWILASPFSPSGQERSPKSAPQHEPTVGCKCRKTENDRANE